MYRSLHHKAVDVRFPADAVEWSIFIFPAASVRPWYRLRVGHVTILKGNQEAVLGVYFI